MAAIATPSVTFRPAAPTTRSAKQTWITWGIALMVAAFLGAVSKAAPVTLYDSIGSNTADGSDSATDQSWFANQFLTDADPYTLDSVVLNFVSAPVGTIRVDVYNTAAGFPGSSVGTLSHVGGFNSGNNSFSAAGLPSLLANTSYWVVLRGVTGGSVDWNYTTGSVSGPWQSTYTSSFGGVSWTAPADGAPYLMQVIGTPASNVPEIDPGSLGSVMALVTGALGLIERRRVRKA